jgi:predicted phosphoribosyltransferase
MFRDREDAARQLAAKLKGQDFHDPLVLAIPRGGVVIGSILAREIGADLDVLLSRKLRAPNQPELAIGAVSENGDVYLSHHGEDFAEYLGDYLQEERDRQLAEIKRRKRLFRSVRPAAPIADRSVIVTDDGIATGSTMIAGLRILRAQNPHELIVAVPVASPSRMDEVRPYCDEAICLLCPESFWAIGQFYDDFEQLDDEQVVDILREFNSPSETAGTRSS